MKMFLLIILVGFLTGIIIGDSLREKGMFIVCDNSPTVIWSWDGKAGDGCQAIEN
jgi:hypothetical protein